ncbi:uncharacterized protein LOC126733423 isoform X2 [Anthonomus grandis grandis]|uniref:uncharacterized protein LOC126733423 isoform X2 n=1 Tax=Anthonomus grandis grandis TaxID=2921223 RepID=UPI002165EDB7|nr:uncharacterized protein LOC126733423 isoform X2 [Anthonomus grandis grandis]
MSHGIGRGRGWLNLKAQNQTINAPGSENAQSPPALNNLPPPKVNSNVIDTFSDAQNDYSSLVSKIKHLDINDDGIMFNQKIKHIIESWYQDCQNAPEVEQSFNLIYEASLADPETAGKLVLLIASRTFLSQEIHEQNIRMMFLRKLQQSFETCVQLQSASPNLFRNSVQLMGEFFNKARMANGQQFTFMSAPLLSYLDMLLDSGDCIDLKLFTTQLYLNGNTLKQECPDRVTEILGKIRLMLTSDQKYTSESKLWLLLAIEMANNRFALLPAEVHNFYQEHLGDHAMAFFQGSHGALTVQPVHSKKLENYQSHINVLQVSDPPSESAQNNVSGQSNNSSGIQSDFISHIGKDTNDQVNLNNTIKSGRPILGAGARLQKNRVHHQQQQDDNSSNWSQGSKGDNETNWREKKPENNRKDWGDKKKGQPKMKKGWEHDDSRT